MSSASALSLDLIWARDRILDRFQTYCREAGGDPSLLRGTPPRSRNALSARSPNVDASLLGGKGPVTSADRAGRSEGRRRRCRHHRHKNAAVDNTGPEHVAPANHGRPSPTDAVMEFVDACKVRGIPDDVVHEHAMFMIEAIRESMEHAAERHRLQQDVDASQYDASLGGWLASVGSSHFHQSDAAGSGRTAASRHSATRGMRHHDSTATGTVSTTGLSPVAHAAAGHSPSQTPPPPSMPPPADAVDSSIVSLSDSAMRRSIVRGAFSGGGGGSAVMHGRAGAPPSSPEAPLHQPPADALTPPPRGGPHHTAEVTVVSPLSDPRGTNAAADGDSSPPVGGNVGASYQAMVSSYASGGSAWRGSAIGSATRRRDSSVATSAVLCDTGTQFSPPPPPPPPSSSTAHGNGCTPETKERSLATPQSAPQAPPWSPPGQAMTAQRKYTPHSQARAKVAGTTPQVDSPRRRHHSPATRADVSSTQAIRDSALRNARVRTEHAECAASSARRQVSQLKRSSSAASRHVERQRAARERQEERKAELARRAALPAGSALRRPSASRARSASVPGRSGASAVSEAAPSQRPGPDHRHRHTTHSGASRRTSPDLRDAGESLATLRPVVEAGASAYGSNSRGANGRDVSPDAVAPSPQRPLVVRRELFGAGNAAAGHRALRPTVRTEDVHTLRSALRATSHRSPSSARGREDNGKKAGSTEPPMSATVSSPTATEASLPPADDHRSASPPEAARGPAQAFRRVVQSPVLDSYVPERGTTSKPPREGGARSAMREAGATPPPPLPLTDDTARASSSSPAPANLRATPSQSNHRRPDGYPSPPEHSPRQNPSGPDRVDPTRPIDWRPLRSFSPVGPGTEAFLSRAARSIRAASGEQQRAASRTPLRRAGASLSPTRSGTTVRGRRTSPQRPTAEAARKASAPSVTSTTDGSSATTTVTRTVNAFTARRDDDDAAVVDDAVSVGTSIGESTIADMVI